MVSFVNDQETLTLIYCSLFVCILCSQLRLFLIYIKPLVVIPVIFVHYYYYYYY